jgi:hypothetical protein
MNNIHEYIKTHTLRLEASRRGGGIEIDAEEYTGIEGAKMTAYQNYLGGGMTGAIGGSKNFEETNEKAEELAEALKRYFYNITNEIVEDYDEWASSEGFEAQQNRAESGY